MTSRDLLRVL